MFGQNVRWLKIDFLSHFSEKKSDKKIESHPVKAREKPAAATLKKTKIV